MPWGERGRWPSSDGDGRIENQRVRRVDKRICTRIKDSDPHRVTEPNAVFVHLRSVCQVAVEFVRQRFRELQSPDPSFCEEAEREALTSRCEPRWARKVFVDRPWNQGGSALNGIVRISGVLVLGLKIKHVHMMERRSISTTHKELSWNGHGV